MVDERRVALAKMTSPEAAEALAGAEVALIPVGATEQHGPNMTLETDTVVAYRLPCASPPPSTRITIGMCWECYG
jgi:hypothetical protein